MTQRLRRTTVTILSGQSISSLFTLDGNPPTILEMPAAWTAADLSFLCSGDGVTHMFMCDNLGAPIVIPTGVNHRIVLPYAYLEDNKFLSVYSGTPVASVPQGADRIITLEVWV
jgi:hypothetical protein